MCLVTKWWDTATLQIGDNPHSLLQNWIWCCDWPRFQKLTFTLFPAKEARENIEDIPLPSCVFLWTPQQRLRVQPDLFCCTQNLPRSPLQWDGGPELMDGFKMLLSRSEMLQFVLWVLVMLHLVLQIYFMIGWYVSYCIKKGCCSDMVHSHALCRMGCVQNHTEQTALSLDNKNPELNCISTSCQSLTHLGSLVAALHYDQNRLNILLCPSQPTFSLHDGTSAGHDHAKVESRCRHRAIC